MPYFLLTKTFGFEASHQLPHHDGKCARLHGHSWTMDVAIEGSELELTGAKQGMLVDYAVIKSHVAPLVEKFLDHYHLNESTGLENPTSEAIANWVFDALDTRLATRPGVRLAWVEVHETCTTGCRYGIRR